VSRRRVFAVLVPIGIGVVVALFFGTHRDAVATAYTAAKDGPQKEIKHDTSKPLRSIAPKHDSKGKHIRDEFRFPNRSGSGGRDPVVQTSAPTGAAPVVGSGFQGVPAVNSLPPDPNAAVGLSQIVEIVNQSFQVFDKSGNSLYGPADTNTIWSGFGGGCETENDGDATVAYDRAADRWVIQQFALEPYWFNTGEFLECVAVSQTGDATGEWHRYAFNGFEDAFPDYPKLGVWPDGYYTTFNLFTNDGLGGYTGPRVCAYERDKMLVGDTASQQCQSVDDTDLNGFLPSDVDSSTPPPSGSPNYLLGLYAPIGSPPSLRMFKYSVDWATPANTTLSGPTTLSGVPAFTLACGGGNCIPQQGVSQRLDSLGDRLMYRLAYRNFGDHESLVVTHSVGVGSSTGVRWYEIRDPGAATPAVYQSGTFAPDSKYRWMGRAAMDKDGDIALGYSVSNASMYPSIAVTGRLAEDPLGTMGQGETLLKAGNGSQTAFERWGDYSSMSIDPSDDCTFWYTSEYLPNTDFDTPDFNWTTWIGSFDLCNASPSVSAPTNDFSMTAGPASLSIKRGKNSSTKILTAKVSGAAEKITVTVSGKPSGVSTSLSSKSVTAGSSSKLSITVSKKTVVGVYTLVVTGTAPSATHQVPVTLTVK
jgi:hypothetical protein